MIASVTLRLLMNLSGLNSYRPPLSLCVSDRICVVLVDVQSIDMWANLLMKSRMFQCVWRGRAQITSSITSQHWNFSHLGSLSQNKQKMEVMWVHGSCCLSVLNNRSMEVMLWGVKVSLESFAEDGEWFRCPDIGLYGCLCWMGWLGRDMRCETGWGWAKNIRIS